MGDPSGFLKYKRHLPSSRPVGERISDYKEIYLPFPAEKTLEQAARCMDCGTPFCHSGCPLGNIIPEFNDAVFRGQWDEAFQILASTNNFPEFTGRICPAPCEGSCVLGINQPPVAIEFIEKSIAEKAYELGYYKPNSNIKRSGFKVAVIGSGPSGLAAADELNKYGHSVTLFERKDRLGGLLRYGIPDFKLEKWVLDRRIAIMEEEGVSFRTSVEVGKDIPAQKVLTDFDAVVLCGGSTIPRDLSIPGRTLQGIYFAMDYLEQSNRRQAGDRISPEVEIDVKNKHVLVIGGGDTGSDCVGTSNRLGAARVTQIEILGKPPLDRTAINPWPEWPLILRSSSSHEEGCERQWAITTKAFAGNASGHVEKVTIADITWDLVDGRPAMKELAGTVRDIKADFVFLALGYLHPQHHGLLEALGLTLDDRGNVSTKDYLTSVPKVFSAGDMRRGQSLVVWAIAEGRQAAERAHQFLIKPTK